MIRSRKGDVPFLLAIFLIFLFLFRDSFTYPAESQSFPKLIILGILVISGGLLAAHFLMPSSKRVMVSPGHEDSHEIEREPRPKGRFLRGWASIILSLIVAFLFGLVFLIPASFLSYTLLLGKKRMFMKVLFLSLVTAALVYVLLDFFLGVPMTQGVLWRK